jgi:hypothetical protein
MRQFKIVNEKHPESYVAYPIGITGAVVGPNFLPSGFVLCPSPLEYGCLSYPHC